MLGFEDRSPAPEMSCVDDVADSFPLLLELIILDAAHAGLRWLTELFDLLLSSDESEFWLRCSSFLFFEVSFSPSLPLSHISLFSLVRDISAASGNAIRESSAAAFKNFSHFLLFVCLVFVSVLSAAKKAIWTLPFLSLRCFSG